MRPTRWSIPSTPLTVRRARGDDDEWLQPELDAERKYCFDLESDWPIRAAVLSTPDYHVLSMVVHHIAADHWSAGVLFTDVLDRLPRAACRRAVGAGTASGAVRRLRGLAGRLAGRRGRSVVAQRDYWTQQLAGAARGERAAPRLPAPAGTAGGGRCLDFTIDGRHRAKLVGLTRELGVTEFMLLQAAVAVALHKAGEGVDIPLGTPVAGRTEPELDQLIGFFINIVVLRNDLAGNPTLREVLRRAREMALAAYKHQDLPFDRVVDAVSPVRSLSRNPLFGVVVHVREELPADRIIDSGPDGETRFTALEPTFDVAHADLSVNFFADRGRATRAPSSTAPSCTSAPRERLVGWFHRVIDAFADDADQTLRDITITEPRNSRRGLEPRRAAGARPRRVARTRRGRVTGDVYYAGAAFADGAAPHR